MTQFLPKIMLISLSCTIVIELIFALVIGVKSKRDFLNIVLVNLLTNPIVVSVPYFLNIRYGLLERNIALASLELLTFVTEGIIYKKYLEYKKINSFILSFMFNLASYFIGNIINLLIY